MPDPVSPSRPARLLPWILIAVTILIGAIWIWSAGRWLICDCGRIDLWAGKNSPDGSSQHIADWYTPSHMIHGFLFFWLAWLLLPRWPLAWRLWLAVLVEVVWEVVENAPFIIERYRQVTVSKDYNGDTVVNSVADVLFMMLGFWLASRLPVWLSLALVLGAELLALAVIRDGLLLNVLMLIWPVPGIAAWQAGA